jgi:glycosyltransferase involved in cell wall biosynthesis
MLSIITPVYNGIQFIESCIQVVINQDCLSVEHIIIDGGSTDQTVEIIKSYADQYPHIRWVSEPDRGQSDAMNKGIQMAKGNILAILNVDDYYEPNVLNQVLEIFKSLPEPSLLVGNCQTWDHQNQLLGINKPKNLTLTDLLVYEVNPHPVNPSAYFYHTSLHHKIGLYKVDEQFAMDLDFLLRAVQIAQVKYVDEVWGNYRYIPGTKTFNDITEGSSHDRAQKIFHHYKQQLPSWQRWQVSLRQQFHRSHPGKKISSLLARFKYHLT